MKIRSNTLLTCSLFLLAPVVGACDPSVDQELGESMNGSEPEEASTEAALAQANEDSELPEDPEFRGASYGRGRRSRGGRRGSGRRRTGRRSNSTQCLVGENAANPKDRMVRVSVQPLAYSAEPIQILQGEKLSIEVKNLGEGYFEHGTIYAAFSPSGRDPGSTEFRPNLGWGLDENSPESSTLRGIFTQLKSKKSVRVTPNVGNTCSPVFPYDTDMNTFEFRLDVLCRADRRDGIMSFKLVAEGRGGSRVLRDFTHEVCLTPYADYPSDVNPYLGDTYRLGDLPKGNSYRDYPWGFIRAH